MIIKLSVQLSYNETVKVSEKGHKALAEFLNLQQHLYIDSLEEQESRYRATGQVISLSDQYKSLTVIRKEVPEYEICSVRKLRRTDRAFKSFFKHVKEKPKSRGTLCINPVIV